ncbi:hypothetical protein [Rhodopseudomonas sp. B29]|uniref:hypothetical protein n=1 Tax=Rhodopseudomonas sp. B29 TaxID=95607 RepID=UPI00034C182D|nr:hypothetical protein [Rhodopseudomonas sp. B29]
MILLTVAGIGFLMAGLLAIGFGVPVKEFSFGNTLILSGVVGACTGMLLLGLAIVLRELRALAERVGSAASERDIQVKPLFPEPPRTEQASDGRLFPGDRPEPAGRREPLEPAAAEPPPWQQARRDRPAAPPPPAEEPESDLAPPPLPSADPGPKRRNLLFSSTSRRERERAAARSGEVAAEQDEGEAAAAPPRSFDDAWLGPTRRARPAAEEAPEPPAAPVPDRPSLPRGDEPQQVTVIKSGVVDGMSYSLYSDGSIEAQMPEGMMRFASIDELRAHLEQRG